ncbi:MAG: family 78 glycoside hydrolase catalytic domain [Parasporobacterium sp.]|nr:family 78 glycoside hydrolase catalytic domain [Parasporobacterium sp.]
MTFENIKFITSDIKESPEFFREFSLEAEPCKATLLITGLGLYNAYINGVKAGDAYLAPGSNEYSSYLRYQEIDVTDLVRSGDNKIEVLLGNGWYKGQFGLMPRQGLDELKYYLAAELVIETAAGSGESIIISADETWMAQESCIRSNSIYSGEIRDDFFSAEAQFPCKIADVNFNVIPEICPPVREKLTMKPELIITTNGEKVLDFKQNMAGIIRFHSTLKAGQKIELKFGEILIDGNFCNENLREAGKGGYIYISDGIEKDVEAIFTYFGFRYVKVNTDADVNPDDFTAVVLYSDLKETMHVTTSNPKLNRLLQNSLWGQRSNFLDVPTDCPQRDERLGWTGDAQAFANTACFHMDCEDFYRKYLKDLRVDQALLGGNITMFSPCFGDAAPGGPAWADAATIIPWTVYEHYGNPEDLKEFYPLIKDYVDTLIRVDNEERGNHIVENGHCFGDWLAMDGATPNSFKGGTDDVFVRAVYYWNSVSIASRSAAVIGEAEDAQHYGMLAEEIKAAIQDEFFSKNGRLSIDTQAGYVLALHFDLCPDRNKVIEGFKRRLSQDQLKLKTGFVGTSFLLQTLFECGMDDYAYRMLFTEEFPGWLYAINLGATTIWERWNSVMPDGTLSPTGMNSLNHYSYGAVASSVYSCIAGLRNAAPGWKKAVIEPHPNYRLRSIDMAFDSPAGTYRSAWEIQADGSIKLSVTIPEGTEARIILPLHPENAEYEAGPGTYEYAYMPTVDFLHPYNADTFICDIAGDENAVNALKAAVPGFFEGIFATYTNNSACNLDGAIFFTPIQNLPQIIDETLRGVKVEIK